MATGKTRKRQNDYAVGWLAALPCERAAAKLVLSEEHDRPTDFQQPTTDPNAYTWGHVAGHDVVIASLPSGQIGTVSAISTAKSMISSFPKIRFVLMVGIGGAIPRNGGKDIRLGDIVVGQRVYQYDLGVRKGDSWENTSHLNNPPPLLLSSLAALESDLLLGSTPVAEYVEEAISRLPRRNQKNFIYPGPEQDYLFHSDYAHSGGNDCTSCDMSKLVSREPREDSEPVIHVGYIASGNTVVKDTDFRDFVSSLLKTNCICFEMEAAGLMNDMPCMAVRGISDYADTHTNKRWQQYAAITSAAFAKHLLSYVAREDVVALPDALQSIQEDIKQIKAETTNLTNRSQENHLRNWIKPCDPSINHVQARKLCLSGTGSWFLNSNHYLRWKEKDLTNIWLHGIPGCGKTILSSTIIEDLKAEERAVLYFYFDFKDSQKITFENMLRTLIFQLYHQCEKSQKHLDDLLISCRDGQEQPHIQKMEMVLQNMLNHAQEAYIVLDALDECRPWKDLLGWLEAKASNLSILMTSRREHEIEASLQLWIHTENRLAIGNKTVDNDIRKMVQDTIQTDRELVRWKEKAEICNLIEDSLMKKANGMFRWAVCQLDIIRECLDKKSLLKALKELPEGLNETYARILEEIPNGYKPNAIRLLQFLTFSIRPLKLEEAVEILAVDLKKKPHFEQVNRMPLPHEMASYCGSLTALVTRETKHGAITELQLAHLSVQEYLTSQHLDNEYQEFLGEICAKSCIVQVCLAYLFEASQAPSITIQQRQLETGKLREAREEQFPLEKFAADSWTSHGQTGEKEANALEWIVKLFTDEVFYMYWSAMNLHTRNAQPLYIVSYWGMEKSARRLLERGADVLAGDSVAFFLNPPYAACRKGYINIVALLLDSGADITPDHRNGLHASSEAGHIDVVTLLLDRGADTDGDYVGKPALYAACKAGHIDIVTLLLNRGAGINGVDTWSDTPLCAASEAGHIDIVTLLLDRGADVNKCDFYGSTPLHVASSRSTWRVVSHGDNRNTVALLLNRGADINKCDNQGRTPLWLASYNGNLEVVRLLLKRGASVGIDTTNEDGWTPLYSALRRRGPEVAQLLLHNGADPYIETRSGDNPCSSAISRDYLGIVKLIHHGEGPSTSEGVNQFRKDSLGRTVLHYAAAFGKVSIFDYLLDSCLTDGSDIMASEDNLGRNMLDYASISCSVKMVQRVLEHDEDKKLCVRPSKTWSPLHWACQRGEYSVLKLLIESGITWELVRTARPVMCWSPFHIAVYWENMSLLSYKIDIDDDLSLLQTLMPGVSAAKRRQVLSSTIKPFHGVEMVRGHERRCAGCFKKDIHRPQFCCEEYGNWIFCLLCKHDAAQINPKCRWLYKDEDVEQWKWEDQQHTKQSSLQKMRVLGNLARLINGS